MILSLSSCGKEDISKSGNQWKQTDVFEEYTETFIYRKGPNGVLTTAPVVPNGYRRATREDVFNYMVENGLQLNESDISRTTYSIKTRDLSFLLKGPGLLKTILTPVDRNTIGSVSDLNISDSYTVSEPIAGSGDYLVVLDQSNSTRRYHSCYVSFVEY